MEVRYGTVRRVSEETKSEIDIDFGESARRTWPRDGDKCYENWRRIDNRMGVTSL